jgi:hypothetical protein
VDSALWPTLAPAAVVFEGEIVCVEVTVFVEVTVLDGAMTRLGDRSRCFFTLGSEMVYTHDSFRFSHREHVG